MGKEIVIDWPSFNLNWFPIKIRDTVKQGQFGVGVGSAGWPTPLQQVSPEQVQQDTAVQAEVQQIEAEMNQPQTLVQAPKVKQQLRRENGDISPEQAEALAAAIVPVKPGKPLLGEFGLSYIWVGLGLLCPMISFVAAIWTKLPANEIVLAQDVGLAFSMMFFLLAYMGWSRTVLTKQVQA